MEPDSKAPVTRPVEGHGWEHVEETLTREPKQEDRKIAGFGEEKIIKKTRKKRNKEKVIRGASEFKLHDTEIQGELRLGSKFLGFACTAGQLAPVQYGCRSSETNALGEASIHRGAGQSQAVLWGSVKPTLGCGRNRRHGQYVRGCSWK